MRKLICLLVLICFFFSWGKCWASSGDLMLSPRHFMGTVINPHGVYAKDHEILLCLATTSAITITSIKITCDADPATELDIDLMWADAFIGQANATVVDICDTTSGTTTITSGFDDATVANGKALYWRFGTEPIAAITQFNFDIEWDYDYN